MDTTTIIAALGVLIAGLFWIVTQWNIIKTKRVLLEFSAASKAAAHQEIATAFAAMDERLLSLSQELPSESSMKAALSQSLANLPDQDMMMTDLDALLTQRLTDLATALQTNLTHEIISSIDAKMRSIEGVKARQLMQGLKPFGVAVDTFTDGIEAGLLQSATAEMDPTQTALLNLAAFQPSPKWAKDNPVAAMLLQAGKGQLLQQAQGMMGGNALNKGNTLTDKSGIFG